MARILVLLSLLFFASFSAAQTTTTSNLVCGSNALGSIPSLFNGFFTGNFLGQNSEVLGRLACAGNVTLSGGYAVASGLFQQQIRCDANTNGVYQSNLVVGGNLNWQNGRIFSGHIICGGQVNLGQPVSAGVQEQGCQVIRNSTFLNFASLSSSLASISLQLSRLTQTATNVQLNYGTNLEFDISGAANYEVISLDAQQLLSATVVNLRNVNRLAATATLIFNVRGQRCGCQNIGLQSIQPFSNRIIWNFYECTQMTLTGVNFPGSILALQASVTGTNGNIDGQLFGKNFNGNLEFHNVLFNSCLPLTTTNNTTPVPTPTPCCDVICGMDALGRVPQLFNGFFFGNFTGVNSELLGRLACGGDVTLVGGYGISTQLFAVERPCRSAQMGEWLFNLVAGGSVTWQTGRVHSGGISYGNQLNLGQSVSAGVTEQGCSVVKNASLIAFAEWKQYFLNMSTSLSQLNATATGVQLSFGTNLGFNFGGAGAQFEVIKLNASQLMNSRVINANGNAGTNATTIIFNVYGSRCGFQNMGFGTLAPFAQRIIWNFVDCVEMTIVGVSVPGVVLAVNARVTANNGNIDGHMIGQNFNGNLEFHNVPFSGCVHYCYAQCGTEIPQ